MVFHCFIFHKFAGEDWRCGSGSRWCTRDGQGKWFYAPQTAEKEVYSKNTSIYYIIAWLLI